MVFCETGDTLSLLAAAQYLVGVAGQTIEEVERCLAEAGCVTPLVDAFAAVLRSVYNQRNHIDATYHHHQQQEGQVTQSNAADVDKLPPTTRRQRLSRQRSESTILDAAGRRSQRPVMTIEAWPENR